MAREGRVGWGYDFGFQRPTVLPAGSCIQAKVPVGMSIGGVRVLPAQGLGAFQVGGDVVDGDVERGVVMGLVSE